MIAQNFVMLATADDDVGLTWFEDMIAAGQDAADSLGVAVAARDPLTDVVVATFEPVAVIG